MRTTLTPEQSATLIAKGISTDKASERTPDYKDINNTGKPLERRELLPIFTLADILSLLPKELKYDSLGRPYILHIEIEKDRAIAAYRRGWDSVVGADKRCPELIDALYSLLCWVIDKGYIDLTK